MTEALFHIVSRAEWDAAVAAGSYAPASLDEQGFVHFSYRHQVARTANLLYSRADGLVVVEFDPDPLGAPVIDEDLYDAGEDFPHVYAEIPVAAATAVHPLSRAETGDYTF